MISIADMANVHDFRGLSSDEKPHGTENGAKIGNGSTFLELDTSDVYIYDRENDQWLLLG